MRGLLHALFLITVTTLAMPAGAAVYKCNINGETRYQGQPCPGDREAEPHLEFKPDPSADSATSTDGEARTPSSSRNADTAMDGPATKPRAPSAPPRERRDRDPPPLLATPVDDSPMSRVAQLAVDIEAAERELRAVVDERRDVMADLDVRLAANGSDSRLLAERKQRESEYRDRRFEVSDRLRRLRDELNQACPNGTFLNGTRQACR